VLSSDHEKSLKGPFERFFDIGFPKRKLFLYAWIWIRIQNLHPDPDPEIQLIRISIKIRILNLEKYLRFSLSFCHRYSKIINFFLLHLLIQIFKIF